MVSHDAEAKGEQECRARVQKASDEMEKKALSSTLQSGGGFQNLQGGSLRVELSRSPPALPTKSNNETADALLSTGMHSRCAASLLDPN
jgi:hypothetical protein